MSLHNVSCPNIALSDVFAQSCQSLPNGLPSGVVENLGPVQAMTRGVPAMSPARLQSAPRPRTSSTASGTPSGVAQWNDVNLDVPARCDLGHADDDRDGDHRALDVVVRRRPSSGTHYPA